jgi:vitamin B12 transporter
MKTNFISLLTLFVFVQTESAQTIFADTIPIPEITITSSRENFYSEANLNYSADSNQRSYFGLNSIGDVLQRFTPAQISSYGVGGISTISIRGTADDQTNVLWNGIRINSATLGTMDISLIPVHAASSVQVVTNASGAVLGNGNFGGSILLNTIPVFEKHFSLSVRQDISSFSDYRTNLSWSVGTKKVYFSSASFFQDAQNNFTFVDRYKPDNPLETIQHNETRQWASVHQLNIKLPRSQFLEAGNFTLQKHHNIPAIMGGYQNSKKYQDDFSTKSYVKYQKVFNQSQFYIRSGYVYDYMLYDDSLSRISAPYYVHQLQQSANYRHFLKHGFVLDAGLDYHVDLADVQTYADRIVQHRGALFSGVNYTLKQLKVSATVRQEISGKKYIRPQFGLVVSYTEHKNRVNMSLSYADKFRYPDLNDLYWQPGGNVDLKPENGFTAEYNLLVQSQFQHSMYGISFLNSVYYTSIRNTIVWTPLNSGLYSPQNIKQTAHYGHESTLKQVLRWNATNAFSVSVNYNFNRAVIVKDAGNAELEGNFIRYKPQHSIKAFMLFEDRFFNFGCNYTYVGHRYTDDENISVFSLPAHSLLDMFLSFKGSFKSADAEIVFKVNNLLNTSYEVVRSYAQPLRNYNLSFIFNLKTNLQ